MSITKDSNGWSVVSLPGGDKRVYVSQSVGNDSNNGLTTGTPKKTVSAGLALVTPGSGDHLLFKCGDTWTGETLGSSVPSGRSASERIVFGTYGTGNRPKFLTGTDSFINDITGFSNVVIQGLHINPHTRVVDTEVQCLRILGACNNFLLEDCYLENAYQNVTMDLTDGGTNITIRRNQIVDAWGLFSSDNGHQGVYLTNTVGVLVEENIIDHNGSNPAVGSGGRDRDHGLYFVTCREVKAYNNWLSRIPGNAMKHVQSDSTLEVAENVFARNGYSGMFGVSVDYETPAGVVLEFTGNVCTESDVIDGVGGGAAWGFGNLQSSTISGNLVSNSLLAGQQYPGTDAWGWSDSDIDGAYGVHDVSITGNVQYRQFGSFTLKKGNHYDVDGIVFSGNIIQEPGLTHSNDPSELVQLKNFTTGFTATNNTYQRGGNGNNMFNINDVRMTFSTWDANAVTGAGESVATVSFPDAARTAELWMDEEYSAVDFEAGMDAIFRDENTLQDTDRIDAIEAARIWIRQGFNLDGGIPLDLATGLLSYHKFDETSGTSAADATGNGHTGTLSSGMAFTSSGKKNYGMLGDVTNDRCALNHYAQSEGASAWTFAFWYKPAASLVNDIQIISKLKNDGGYQKYWSIASGGAGNGGNNDLLWYHVNGGVAALGHTTGDFLAASTWGHWVWVFDGTQADNATRLKCYFNGVQRTLTFSGTILTATYANLTDPFTIGYRLDTPAATGLNGTIDELGMWNRALTAAEAAFLFNGGVGASYDQIVSGSLGSGAALLNCMGGMSHGFGFGI